jgi:hypothetical protein
MEATTLSVGKSVLDGALGYAKSTVAEEVALQFGIQRDHAFIRDELEMMQAFLMVAHEDRDQHKVLMTWVKQVRDVAYDTGGLPPRVFYSSQTTILLASPLHSARAASYCHQDERAPSKS